MTRLTIHGRRLVKHNRLPAEFFGKHVTFVTSYVHVPAFERESCFLFMIKCRRNPALFVVAVCTSHYPVARCELPAMGIQVAAFALCGSSFELSSLRPVLQFVTIVAGDRAMRAQ